MPRFAAAGPTCVIDHPMFNLNAPTTQADALRGPAVENNLHDALFAPETSSVSHKVNTDTI
jgi:hypothetical protein